MLVSDKSLMKTSHLGVYPNVQCLYSTIPRDIRMHMYRVSQYAESFLESIYSARAKAQEKDYASASPAMMALFRELPEENILEYSEQIFLYHDIGRHYISMEIYNKVEALTEAEKQEIRNHTSYALKAEKSVFFPFFPESIMPYFRETALYHHERWDGKGYPEGMKKREIPIMARICAIADTYDGLTSWKSYRESKTCEEALEILKEEAGKQFEPILTEAFYDIRNEIGLLTIIMNGK